MNHLMKAIRIHNTGGPEVMRYEDCPIPSLSAGQVLVKNHFIGVNYIDTYHRTGMYPLKLPFTLGRDGAGIVEQILEDPDNPIQHNIKVGDRVAYPGGSGTYAQYTAAPLVNVIKVPDNVSLDVATAAMIQGLTAHYLVKNGSYNVKPGDTVLVHAAAGGLGKLIAQIAKIQGASKVIGATSTEEKAKLARAVGVDEVILYTQQDFLQETKRIMNGKGVNVVYDSVGKDTFDKSLECLGRRGFLVLCGASSGKVPPFDLQLLAKGSLTVNRPTLYDYVATREEFVDRCNDLWTWLQEGKLKINIDKQFQLNEAAEAHKYIESRQSAGKVLLIPPQ